MHFSGTYLPDDVHILLKPAEIAPVDVAEKELLIQSGAKHYSEMLSAEKVPDSRYMSLFSAALQRNASRLHGDIMGLAEAIADRPETTNECVIISLARAGTPIGVLVRRALSSLGVQTHHYSVSIIRGRGIDENALRFIKARHGTTSAVFVDGWTGKGAIKRELDASVLATGLGFKPFLAVVADPAGCADLAATTEDYVIPSGLLNGIVSGLISRSVLTDDLVGPDDYHACLFQTEHAAHDISQAFIEAIEAAPIDPSHLTDWTVEQAEDAQIKSRALMANLQDRCGVTDINRIKPGIAEATRAILRRVPDRLFVSDLTDPEVQHICHLAAQAGVPIDEIDLGHYRAVTIIKSVGGEQE